MKYKDLVSECHRTKSLLKGIMIVFKTKGPQIRYIPHGSFGLSQCKSSSKKNMLARVPGKPISANRGVNFANRGIHFVPRLDSVPESMINLNLGIN